jgi:hypothetical protein
VKENTKDIMNVQGIELIVKQENHDEITRSDSLIALQIK